MVSGFILVPSIPNLKVGVNERVQWREANPEALAATFSFIDQTIGNTSRSQ
jgi:hypothetical protein